MALRDQVDALNGGVDLRATAVEVCRNIPGFELEMEKCPQHVFVELAGEGVAVTFDEIEIVKPGVDGD